MFDDYEYDYDAIHKTEIFAIVIGIVTSILPLSVVFILLYRERVLLRDRPLVHYILMIAISDFFVSITAAMGYPPAGTTIILVVVVSSFTSLTLSSSSSSSSSVSPPPSLVPPSSL